MAEATMTRPLVVRWTTAGARTGTRIGREDGARADGRRADVDRGRDALWAVCHRPGATPARQAAGRVLATGVARPRRMVVEVDRQSGDRHRDVA